MQGVKVHKINNMADSMHRLHNYKSFIDKNESVCIDQKVHRLDQDTVARGQIVSTINQPLNTTAGHIHNRNLTLLMVGEGVSQTKGNEQCNGRLHWQSKNYVKEKLGQYPRITQICVCVYVCVCVCVCVCVYVCARTSVCN